MNNPEPYVLYPHGGGGFVCFESTKGDLVALPLMALARAVLRTRGAADELVLEFETGQVTLNGAGLRLVLDHLLAGRVQVIRRGRFEACTVESIDMSAA